VGGQTVAFVDLTSWLAPRCWGRLSPGEVGCWCLATNDNSRVGIGSNISLWEWLYGL